MALYSAGTEDNNDTLYQRYLAGEVPVLDPYTRSLAERGIQEGNTYALLTPEGYQAELERRRTTLEQSVVPQAEAQMGVALGDVRKQMAAAGKLSSSATTNAMMRTGETYAANVAGTIASGTLGIYSALDTAKEAELNRIYGSGVARTEAEGQMYGNIVSAETSNRIAQINSRTQLQIAEIERNTALSAQEKQLEIAKINAAASIEASRVSGIEAVKEQNAFYTDESGTPKWLLELNYERQDTAWNQAYTMRVFAENVKQWNLTRADSWQQFRQQMELARDEFESEDEYRKWNQEYTMMVFAENVKQWNLSRADSMTQFREQMKLARDEFETDKAYKEWQKEYTEEVFAENVREWNLTRADGLSQFSQEMQLARDSFESESEYRQWQMDYTDKAFAEQIEQQEWDNIESVRQFNASLEWAKENAQMDDTRARDLQAALLMEQGREFDITAENGMTQWASTFNESIREFDISSDRQYEIALATLDLQRDQIANESLSQSLGFMLDVMKDPAIVSYVRGAGETGEAIINSIISDVWLSLADMTDEQLGDASTLGTTIQNIRDNIGATDTALTDSTPLTQRMTLTQAEYNSMSQADKNRWRDWNASNGRTQWLGGTGTFGYAAPNMPTG